MNKQPSILEFRKQALKDLSDDIGVYALCDLDKEPIYIGQSMDGIRTRVRRHITSARSDVIANRQLDVWEVSEVLAWPMPGKNKEEVTHLEHKLISLYNRRNPLINGKIPSLQTCSDSPPPGTSIAILPEDERLLRLEPMRRLPRQLQHLSALFGYILEVKNNAELRRTLSVHFERTSKYYKEFIKENDESGV